MRDAVIVDAVRTPTGKRNGGLSGVHSADLSAHVLRALVERTGIDPGVVDDVVWGCVSQIGEQTFDIARTAVLSAGWPESVPGTTVDRQCGSSQQAVHFAAAGVISGQYDVAVAGGVDPVEDLRSGWAAQVEFGLANPALFRLLSDPGRASGSPAALSGGRVLAARVQRVAAEGRLRVPEERAVGLIQAAGTGVVTTLLSTPAADRDPGLADAAPGDDLDAADAVGMRAAEEGVQREEGALRRAAVQVQGAQGRRLAGAEAFPGGVVDARRTCADQQRQHADWRGRCGRAARCRS